MLIKSWWWGIVVTFCLNVTFLSGNPVKINDTAMGMKFLNMFGYMSDSDMKMNAGMEKDAMMESSIMMYQEYNHLDPTGKLDDRTIRMMESPRCGNDDKAVVHQMQHTSDRRKRHVTLSKWEKPKLTYRFKNYARCCLPKEQIEEEFERATKIWLAAVSLKHLKIVKELNENTEVDIDIEFVRGPHHDNMSFAEMNTIAHAFFPQQPGNDPLRGDIHFNDDSDWTSGKGQKGQSFIQTACHELGHSLGLEHSMAHKAVMHAYFAREDKPDFDLYYDDVKRIQVLYGTPEEVKLTSEKNSTEQNSTEKTPVSNNESNNESKETEDVEILEPQASESIWPNFQSPTAQLKLAIPQFQQNWNFEEKVTEFPEISHNSDIIENSDIPSDLETETACRNSLLVNYLHTDARSFSCLQFLWKQFYYQQAQGHVKFIKVNDQPTLNSNQNPYFKKKMTKNFNRLTLKLNKSKGLKKLKN